MGQLRGQTPQILKVFVVLESVINPMDIQAEEILRSFGDIHTAVILFYGSKKF